MESTDQNLLHCDMPYLSELANRVWLNKVSMREVVKEAQCLNKRLAGIDLSVKNYPVDAEARLVVYNLSDFGEIPVIIL